MQVADISYRLVAHGSNTVVVFLLTCGEDRVACPRRSSSRRSAPETGLSGANGAARVLLTCFARCAGRL